MENLDRVIAFVKVAELQSFCKAAAALKISTAAMSKKIAAFEKELKMELFHRTTRTITLTEAALELYEKAKIIVEELGEIDLLISGLHKQPQGKLKIVCGRYFALRWIIPYIDEFYSQFPQIALELEIGERVADLEKEGIDVLIGISVQGPPEAIQKRIAETRYIMAAAPAYLQKFGMPKKPEDLLLHHHRYINHSMRRPQNVIEFSKTKRLTIKPFLSLNDATAMIGCAICGLGIIRSHDYTVQESLRKNELVEVLREYNREPVPLYAYFRRSAYLPQKIRCFIDFVCKKINQEK